MNMVSNAAPLGSLTWRERFRRYHHLHERKLEAFFFCAGFVFDILATGEGVDHLLMILQQVIYLGLIGAILYLDILREARPGEVQFSPRFEKIWSYRGLLLHFCLGTLMNIYSIFFLLSASFFSSIVFVLLLFGALVLNELKAVRRRGADVKVALYVVCMFCFFSLMFPLLISYAGHFLFGSVGVQGKDGSGFSPVGKLAFLGSFTGTLLVLGVFYRRLRRRLGPEGLRRKLLLPGLSTSTVFLVLYLGGLILPIPRKRAKPPNDLRDSLPRALDVNKLLPNPA